MKVHNFNIKNSDDSVTIIRVVLEENVGLLERERFAQKVFKVKDYKDLNEIIYFVKTIYKDVVIEELEINIFDKRGNLNKKVRYEKDELKDYAVYNISVNGKLLNFVLSDGNLHITDIHTNDLNLGDAANNRAISRMISDELTNISLLGSYNITFNYDEKEIIPLIIDCYNAFFEENLDLTKIDTIDMAKNILAILSSMSIIIMPDNEFSCFVDSEKNKCISNECITKLLTKLLPFKANDLKDSFEVNQVLSYEEYNKISKLGKLIRNASETSNIKLNDLLNYLAIFCYIRGFLWEPDDEEFKRMSIPSQYYDFIRELVNKIDECLREKHSRKLET